MTRRKRAVCRDRRELTGFRFLAFFLAAPPSKPSFPLPTNNAAG